LRSYPARCVSSHHWRESGRHACESAAPALGSSGSWRIGTHSPAAVDKRVYRERSCLVVPRDAFEWRTWRLALRALHESRRTTKCSSRTATILSSIDPSMEWRAMATNNRERSAVRKHISRLCRVYRYVTVRRNDVQSTVCACASDSECESVRLDRLHDRAFGRFVLVWMMSVRSDGWCVRWRWGERIVKNEHTAPVGMDRIEQEEQQLVRQRSDGGLGCQCSNHSQDPNRTTHETRHKVVCM